MNFQIKIKVAPTLTNNISRLILGIYYLLWIPCLLCAYFHVSEDFYPIGKLFGPLAIKIAFVTTIIALAIFLNKRRNSKTLRRDLLFLIAPAAALLPLFIMLLIPNQLEKTTHTILVSYIAYGCDCANWRIQNIDGVDVSVREEDVYPEALTIEKGIPDSLVRNGDRLEVVGNFYSRKGFPKNYYSEQTPNKARVLQYSKYKFIDNKVVTRY
jgi:hypothetical protein